MTQSKERIPPRTRIVIKSGGQAAYHAADAQPASAHGEPREGDEAAYHGAGFAGRYLGESNPRADAEAIQPQLGRSQQESPAARCPHCDTRLKPISSRRHWCPRCKVAWRAPEGSAAKVAGAVTLFAVLVLGVFYLRGSFDHSLYSVGLNWETCARQSADGAISCGDELLMGGESSGQSVKSGVRSLIP